MRFVTHAAEGRGSVRAVTVSGHANGRLRTGDRARARWPETAGTAGAGTIGHWPSTVGVQQCGRSRTGGGYRRSSSRPSGRPRAGPSPWGTCDVPALRAPGAPGCLGAPPRLGCGSTAGTQARGHGQLRNAGSGGRLPRKGRAHPGYPVPPPRGLVSVGGASWVALASGSGGSFFLCRAANSRRVGNTAPSPVIWARKSAASSLPQCHLDVFSQ